MDTPEIIPLLGLWGEKSLKVKLHPILFAAFAYLDMLPMGGVRIHEGRDSGFSVRQLPRSD